MASFELSAFEVVQDIAIVAAIEIPRSGIIKTGFWINDPEQKIVWPPTQDEIGHQDYLWQNTCFELFIGVKEQDYYREINLAPTAWQAYAFEEYRFPEDLPPQPAQDIALLELQRTPFGLTAVIDINAFLHAEQLKMSHLFLGLTAVITTAQKQHFFAMQHSSPQADFHNKRDWLYQL